MTLPISVVVPTHNHCEYVRAAVASVLSQTAKPTELIVIDDGSTDGTRERLREFGDSIRYRYQENQGLSAARNAGIETATNAWVALLDADDLWHPQKLERQWMIAGRCPEYDLVGTSTLSFAQTVPQPLDYSAVDPRWTDVSLRDVVYGARFGSGSAALIKKDTLARVGAFDRSLSAVEDLDLWLRIAAVGRLAKVEESLTFIRVRRGTMSTKVSVMEANHRRVIKKAFRDLPVLRNKWLWKRVALARMHRGLAVMHFEEGRRVAGLLSLGHSFVTCPFTSGTAPRLARTKLALRRVGLHR